MKYIKYYKDLCPNDTFYFGQNWFIENCREQKPLTETTELGMVWWECNYRLVSNCGIVTLISKVFEPPLVEAKPRLIFTIGAARSGKSTYAKKWVNNQIMPELKGPRVIWNTDDHRLAAHGERYRHEYEPLAFGIKQIVIKQLLMDHNVMVDGTHSTPTSIKRLLEINMDAQPIMFDTPEATCIERAKATSQDDLVDYGVISRHCRQIEVLKREGIENVLNRLREEINERNYESTN